MTMTARPLAAAALVAALGLPCMAQAKLGEPVFEPVVSAPVATVPVPAPAPARTVLSFTVGAGAVYAPEFEGSDDYEIRPDISFGQAYLGLRSGRSFGRVDPDAPISGFGIRPSFRYVGERDVDDDSPLAGLPDVDGSLELGLGVSYEQPAYRVFADVRYGVTGHHAFTGELGADAIARPSDRLTIFGGPRVFLGTDSYADTYFSVDEDASLASGLDEFDAGGGVLGAGAEVTARYRLGADWGIEGGVRYNRLTGDAGDSPIARAGDRDQYEVRLGLTRRLTFSF